MRTLTTAKGRSVNTPYSDREALVITSALKSSFAQDLSFKASGRWGLSPDQMTWVHILAVEATGKAVVTPRETESIGSMAAVIAMFKTAQTHLKNPKVRLQFNGYPMALSMAGIRARVPGSINVTDGGPYGNNAYYGRIYANGTFEKTSKAPAGMAEYLITFAANPEQIAAEYGKLTGNCCFCARNLSDERSTEVGYGPICAGNFNLYYPAFSELKKAS